MVKPVFPEIKLFQPVERLKKIGRFVVDRFTNPFPLEMPTQGEEQ